MPDWSRDLRKSKHLADEQIRRIQRALDKGKTADPAYLITLSSNENNQLDIISTLYLRQDSVTGRLPLVVGVARDKKDAVGMVRDILEETIRATGLPDMRSYLLARSRSSDG